MRESVSTNRRASIETSWQEERAYASAPRRQPFSHCEFTKNAARTGELQDDLATARSVRGQLHEALDDEKNVATFATLREDLIAFAEAHHSRSSQQSAKLLLGQAAQCLVAAYQPDDLILQNAP